MCARSADLTLHVRLVALFGLHMQTAPFEVVVINSRISNRSLTAVVTEIYCTGLYLSNDRQFGGKKKS
jgi:hypothetical protein